MYQLDNIPTEGDLIIPLTNDYLFKALMQENEHVLQGLLCSLLNLNEDEIISTEITNSIILGESFTEKTFMLDINLCLNNNRIVNLEMQVIDNHDWQERSLAYLGREFSKLLKGDDYASAIPVHQIGILNYTLFDESPDFYSTYMMKGLKNNVIYSDKFAISVLDLTQIHRATDDDRSNKLDEWARLFSAKTWEDLRMLAQNNPLMAEATNTISKLCKDDAIRDACYRRDLQLAFEARTQRKLKEQAEALAEKDEALAEKDEALAEKDAEIAELKKRLEKYEN